MNFIHRLIIGLSFGRKGWNLAKMPVLELTTTGRKSGIPRSVMLTSPHQEDGSLLIVASKGGSDRPPEWLLNIEKNPNHTFQGKFVYFTLNIFKFFRQFSDSTETGLQ